jgi:sec-independent protein translocase protein TatB
MFGLSLTEVIIIAVVALLLLGPDKLPEAAKTLGKSLREIKKATEDLKDSVEREIYADDKPAKPALVPPVPARPVPGAAGPPPQATPENVPGLEAALAEAQADAQAAPPPTVAEDYSQPEPPAPPRTPIP